MSGAANAKRILNTKAREAVDELVCELTKLKGMMSDFDGDLIEAVALKIPNRDAVANRGIETDKDCMARLEDWKTLASGFRRSYEQHRKELGL